MRRISVEDGKMGKTVAVLLLVALPLTAAEPKPPPVTITLKDRHGRATPLRTKTALSGGGNVDVQQPTPDVAVITLTGAVVAADHPCGASSSAMDFDLDQQFVIEFDNPKVKRAQLSVEARVIGMLRGGRKGMASIGCGSLSVTAGANAITSLPLPEHSVAGPENLAINDQSGPVELHGEGGELNLHAHWHIEASHPKALFGRSASAEFAPDPALDPLWIGGPRDPFHGAGKKDFGLRITLKVEPEAPENGNK
jgi:hypothetical protein